MPTETPQQNFDPVPLEQKTCEQVFFDGFNGIMLSPATSKISFHQVVGVSDSGKEQRKQMLTVVLPTVAMLELCLGYLAHVRENQPSLLSAIDEQKAKIVAGLGSYVTPT